MAMLRAYLTMLPRLDAEHLLAATQVAVAGGSMRMELADARRRTDELRRMAEGDADRPRRRGQRATPEALAAIGIGVVTAEPVETAHG